MNPNEMPYRLLCKSTIHKELIELAKNSNEWFSYFFFDTLLLPESLLEKDPFFKSLPPFKAGILRLPPNTCYDWHVDDERGWTINMLLEPVKSHCLFSKKEGQSFPFIELSYEPGYYYAFNTQIPHTVLNFDETRYLLSVQFDDPSYTPS